MKMRGTTRTVYLLGRYAFKFPRASAGWELFLYGLLANIQEQRFSGLDGVCPVLFGIPGGWLVVMHRATPLTASEWADFDVKAFCDRKDYAVPAEAKWDSFGWVDGKIVAIDYG